VLVVLLMKPLFFFDASKGDEALFFGDPIEVPSPEYFEYFGAPPDQADSIIARVNVAEFFNLNGGRHDREDFVVDYEEKWGKIFHRVQVEVDVFSIWSIVVTLVLKMVRDHRMKNFRLVIVQKAITKQFVIDCFKMRMLLRARLKGFGIYELGRSFDDYDCGLQLDSFTPFLFSCRDVSDLIILKTIAWRSLMYVSKAVSRFVRDFVIRGNLPYYYYVDAIKNYDEEMEALNPEDFNADDQIYSKCIYQLLQIPALFFHVYPLVRDISLNECLFESHKIKASLLYQIDPRRVSIDCFYLDDYEPWDIALFVDRIDWEENLRSVQSKKAVFVFKPYLIDLYLEVICMVRKEMIVEYKKCFDEYVPFRNDWWSTRNLEYSRQNDLCYSHIVRTNSIVHFSDGLERD